MKKSLLFAAAIASAFAANAEVFDYGFNYNNPLMPFLGELNNPESPYYNPNNYDLVDKYGVAMPNTMGLSVLNTPEGAEKGELDLGVAISMLDGGIYKISEEAYSGVNGEELEVMPEENFNYPFLSWGDKGVTRTIFMPGWGSEDAWEDKDYNAANAEDWVSTKNGVQFTRLGTQGIVSHQDTYFQYPAVTGNVTVTVWASCNLGGNTNPDNELKVIVTPVFDGVVAAEQSVEVTMTDVLNKRYYKLAPMTFDANGKNLELRVGCNGAQLNLMHVRIEGEKGTHVGIADIIAEETVETPAYNIMGVQVDSNYKGLVIKNGKKYYQR